MCAGEGRARWLGLLAPAEPCVLGLEAPHQQEIRHRDLKPANILLGADNRPRVADFGLAVHESVQHRLRGERSGTPVYMSPEQIRGETHRLDGRADTWSLGVILYEVLTGKRPFKGATLDELSEEIQHRDPRPLRELKPNLPLELERICFKCLEKRTADRYSTAGDLAADLRLWLTTRQSAPTKQALVKIVPRGLHSFGPEDKDFFLDLVPGPRDREGLPERIRLWKTRVEETNADSTFPVGVVHGASGCGKSSLIKAGLIPRLASHVTPIYVEAAPEDTEVRLLKGLRRRFPDIPTDLELPQVLSGLREGQWAPGNQKILLVMDQFEQWLHAKRAERDPQLLSALRHCDGGRLQALILVRDDFWTATCRFMRQLEIKLLESENQFFVDLFDPLHAKKVLTEFGRAYTRLPEPPHGLSDDQEAFLDRAVQGLSAEGRVICVRLALFADMLKGKSWTLATWRQLGDAEEVAIQFLDETFEASAAPVTYRRHTQAAQRVLKSLLPGTGTDIKGNRRPESELSAIAETADFTELLGILDKDLRLITPTDPAGSELTGEASSDGERYYQLTHDYLVPSLREWLTRKQRETKQGGPSCVWRNGQPCGRRRKRTAICRRSGSTPRFGGGRKQRRGARHNGQ